MNACEPLGAFSFLRADEDPGLGLFYFEHESQINNQFRMNPAINEPSATGMGFLISAEGLVITCSHVILALDARPGETVSLFGASPDVNVEIRATVCTDGWLGPELDEAGQRYPALFWKQLADARPDVFREDIAFLQIDLGSACWHPRRNQPLAGNPAAARSQLLQKARVLPFCRAGYRDQGTKLIAWCVHWICGGPDCQRDDAHYLGFDDVAYHAIRLRSTKLTHGFSGGPLWDEARRTVIGLVRRELATQGDTVLGTDARCFEAHPGAKITADSRLSGLESALRSRVIGLRSAVYEDVTGIDTETRYIWPELTVAALEDPLQPSTPHPQPARTYLPSQFSITPHIILRGGAGRGKTSLLRHLTLDLLDNIRYQNGIRVVPWYLTAQELLDHHFDLGRLLDDIWTETRKDLWTTDTLADVLAENGAELALLIDGLDEISTGDQAILLARVHPALGTRRHGGRGEDRDSLRHHVIATIVATRPSSFVDALLVRGHQVVSSQQMVQVLDLCGLDDAAVRKFCEQAFKSVEVAAAFMTELRKLRWASNRIAPLQLQMAASLFQTTPPAPLPIRALDLTARYVAHMLEMGKTYFVTHQPVGLLLPDEIPMYLESLGEIFGIAAAATLAGGHGTLSEQGFQAALCDPMLNRRSHVWSCNVGALTRFVFHDLRGATTLLDTDRNGEPELRWSHRTFTELLAAEHTYRESANDPAYLKQTFDSLIKLGEHNQGLALLGVLDRSDENNTTIRTLLSQCMSGPGGGTGQQLFAVRALAAGIDARGELRQAQVALLIRFTLQDIRSSVLCMELFSSEGLPDGAAILGYVELQPDIRSAMEARFRFRLARASLRRPAVVLTRESKVLELAGLWPDFIDMGLRRPRAPGEPILRADIAGPATGSGVARLLLTAPDGTIREATLPADQFVEVLATAARGTVDRVTSAQLVELAVRLYLGSEGQWNVKPG